MERVETLVKKLLTQLQQNATAADMLLTTKILQTELQTEATKNGSALQPSIGITVLPPLQNSAAPASSNYTENILAQANTPEVEIVNDIEVVEEEENIADNEIVNVTAAELTNEQTATHQEKIINVLEVDEEELAQELASIQTAKTQHHNIAAMGHTPIEQLIATEPAATEINQLVADNATTLNDKLKQGDLNLGDTLTEAPVKDLRKAIGINDRFLFINELFRGDEAMYERCIKTINNFTILPEAEYWIQRELSVKIGWDETAETVQQFRTVIKRRFL
jgi:hypothetical protein